MRIFYASDTTPNTSFQSNIWHNNLYLPLLDLGHDVVVFQYNNLRKTYQNLDSNNPRQRAFIRKNRPMLSKELLRQIKDAHSQKPINLFFSYFYDPCVLVEAIDEIKSMGIKTVNWYCNGSYQLDLVSEISPHYDWCLVPEKFRLKDYVAMGAHPIYCQEAANPNTYKPYDLPLEFDVTFVGQAYGERPSYIKYLMDQCVDVRVWGWGWKNFSKRSNLLKRALYIGQKLLTKQGKKAVMEHLGRVLNENTSCALTKSPHMVILPASITGGTLTDSEMIEMYSRSKINLGFSSCGNTDENVERIVHLRLRDFEVPMSGGFYVVEYMEELEEFFEIGKEIVCYTDKEDLADKIKYYLIHDIERERIRCAGHERCLRDHSWHKRFQMVFREMGLV